MNYIIRRIPLLAICSLCLATACFASAAEREHIVLNSGAEIIAPIISEDAQRLVIDLGSEVVVVDPSDILSRTTGALSKSQVAQHELYQVGRLDAGPVGELVERHGDSVVMVSTPTGLGSGFFISKEGHIITNYHVVERQTHLRVTRFVKGIDGEQGYIKQEFSNVRILSLHPLRDIALLQVMDEDFNSDDVDPVTLAEPNSLRSGDGVFAIGNPLGLERSVTQGIVSSTTRTLGHLRFIQTDAPINPGNSGGPLFNMRGEVVGIASAGATFFDGLAFGIPIRDVISFLDNRDAYLYDPTQPQNGVHYQAPPQQSATSSK